MIGVEENKRFKFIDINKAFTQVSGLNKAQVIGKYVEEVIPEPDLSIVLTNYNKAIATKANVIWEQTSSYPSGEKIEHISTKPRKK